MHSLAELPHDRSFKIRSDIPAVVRDMAVDSLRRILLNCSKRDKAVLLMMCQGLGEGELVYVSNNCARYVLKCLTKFLRLIFLGVSSRGILSRSIQFCLCMFDC